MRKSAPRIVVSLLAVTMLFSGCGNNSEVQESEIRKPYMDKYHVVHSSGSTGKPGYFVYDDDAWGADAARKHTGSFMEHDYATDTPPTHERPRIIYIAATDGPYGGAMAVGAGIEGVHASQLFLDIKAPLSEWIENVRQLKPNMIIGYPSAIKTLGELVEKGEDQLEVSRVISCGEALGAGFADIWRKHSIPRS